MASKSLHSMPRYATLHAFIRTIFHGYLFVEMVNIKNPILPLFLPNTIFLYIWFIFDNIAPIKLGLWERTETIESGNGITGEENPGSVQCSEKTTLKDWLGPEIVTNTYKKMMPTSDGKLLVALDQAGGLNLHNTST